VAFIFKNMNEQPFAKPIADLTPEQTNITAGGNSFAARDGNIEVPISKYEDVHQVPYAVDFFNVNGYEFGAIQVNVDLLNNYVISKMEERGLTDTKESYEQIINEVFGLLGIEDNTTSENKFNKIVQYINFLNRANDAKKTRDAMKKYLKNN